VSDARPFEELSSSGLLWLINRVVFHPRGYALALVQRGGETVGWDLQGDGSEVWRFDGDEDARFEAAQATLNPNRTQALAKPTCTCPQIDVTRAWEKPGSVTVPGYDPACPVCPDPYAPGDRS
jgi:hypothetical protein